jgi:hypothetical protein
MLIGLAMVTSKALKTIALDGKTRPNNKRLLSILTTANELLGKYRIREIIVISPTQLFLNIQYGNTAVTTTPRRLTCGVAVYTGFPFSAKISSANIWVLSSSAD